MNRIDYAKSYVEKNRLKVLPDINLCDHLNIIPNLTYCGSDRTVQKGVRRTRTMGLRKLRHCKACGRKFTPKKQKRFLWLW